MTIPKIFNKKTGKWEAFITSNSIPILDKSESFESNNVEGALQELAAWKKEMGEGSIGLLQDKVEQHEKDIEWLKANGGGGGGGGTAVPVITSTLEEGTIKLGAGEPLDIPLFFSSVNFGDGTAYISINNVQWGTQTVKQGNNTINIGELTELKNVITIYVKDRARLLSNVLTWTVINGGIDIPMVVILQMILKKLEIKDIILIPMAIWLRGGNVYLVNGTILIRMVFIRRVNIL